MKIVLLNVTYGIGSTGKIVETLYHSYTEAGNDVRVIFGRKTINTNDPFIIKGGYNFESKFHHATSLLTGNIYGGSFLSTFKIIRLLKKIKPDAVHIHCINGYFVNIYMLLKYLKKNHIRTILTNHAEFYYTANCGYSLDCNNWKFNECQKCKRVNEFNGKISLNKTHHYWKKMFSIIENFNELMITSVSPWINKRSKESKMFKTKENTCVMNPVEAKNVSGQNKLNLLKIKLGIPLDNKVVLHVTADYYNPEKGGMLFLNQISEFLKNEKITFVVKSSKKIYEPNKKNLIFVKDSDIQNINDLYSIADCTILLSKSETFSMVTAESLCNGTRVIGFKAGGPESIALEKYSKFVEYGDLNALLNEIKTYTFKKYDRNKIKKEAKEYFDKKTISEQYLKLLKKANIDINQHLKSKTSILYSIFFILFISLCALSNAIPFFESGTIGGKALRVFILIFGFIYFLIAYSKKKAPPSLLSIFLCFIGVFLSLFSVFTISHKILNYTFWKDIQSIFYPITLLLLITLFSRTFFNSFICKEKIKYFFFALCIFSVCFSIYSILDQIINSSLAGSYFYYPHRNFNGFVLSILFSYIVILSQIIVKNKFSLPILFLLFISTLLTLSKTAITGVLIVSIVYSFINFKNHKKLVIGYLSTLFVLLATYFLLMNLNSLRSNYVINVVYTSTYSQIAKTIESRIRIFKNEVVPLLNCKLLFGYGYSYSNVITIDCIDNHYLQIAFSNGIFGLGVMTLFYVSSFKKCFQLLKVDKGMSMLIFFFNFYIILSSFFLSVGPFSVGLFSALLIPIQVGIPNLTLYNNQKKEIRVLHVLNSFKKGGTETFVMNYASALKEKNIIIDVFCCGEYDEKQKEKFEYLGGNFFKGEIFSLKNYLKAIYLLNKHLNNHRYHAIHLNANFDNYSFAIIGNSNYINNIIFHSHDSLTNIHYSLFKRILNSIKIIIAKVYCNTFLACSKEAGCDLLGKRFFSKNGTIIKNIVNFNSYAYPNKTKILRLKKEWNLNNNEIIFGNITRFEPKKNQDFIIDTFKILNKKIPNTKLVLGGPDGGQLKYLMEKVDRLELKESVVFIGPRDDIPECLSLIDYYLFPSLFEGFGIVLLENQISGITTISSKFVPENVDLDIGLLYKLDLSLDKWASFILALQKKEVKIKNRHQAFSKKGFNDTTTLENIYKESEIWLKNF